MQLRIEETSIAAPLLSPLNLLFHHYLGRCDAALDESHPGFQDAIVGGVEGKQKAG